MHGSSSESWSWFLEIVYKDALAYEFEKAAIEFEREKEYSIPYKEIILPHKFYADFVLMDKIILEVKSSSSLSDAFTAQTINYLAASNLRLGLLVNFGKTSLERKRVVL